jgi:hypothetical protein
VDLSDSRMKKNSRPTRIVRSIEVDMSPEAIDRRLRDLGQIYRLGKEIPHARRLGKVRDLRGD